MDLDKNPEQMPDRSSYKNEKPASEPMGFEAWAAIPAPRKTSIRDGIDTGAVKIFLILAGLTAGMALGLRLLF